MHFYVEYVCFVLVQEYESAVTKADTLIVKGHSLPLVARVV